MKERGKTVKLVNQAGRVVEVPESRRDELIASGCSPYVESNQTTAADSGEARVAIVMPSRGSVLSETVDVLGRLTKSYPPFMTHHEKIPEAFNRLVERAMRTDCTHILFLEEDMLPPLNSVERLLSLGADLATAVYVGKNESRHKKPINGEGWSGTGCLLVRRRVFEEMEQPWFRDDVEYVRSSGRPWEAQPAEGDRYGLHDIDFSFRCVDAGYSLAVAEDVVCGHGDLRSIADAKVNGRCHEIWWHYPTGIIDGRTREVISDASGAVTRQPSGEVPARGEDPQRISAREECGEGNGQGPAGGVDISASTWTKRGFSFDHPGGVGEDLRGEKQGC